jgi:hypothetical protein
VSEADDPDERAVLEIDEILVDGRPIVLSQEFDASLDWLDTMSIRVTNVSNTPVVYVALGVGLLPAALDQLGPHESWQHGFGYQYGRPLKRKQASKAATRLEPSQSTVLTAADIDSESRRILNASGGLRRYRRAELWRADVQYADGRTQSGGVGFLRIAHGVRFTQQPN